MKKRIIPILLVLLAISVLLLGAVVFAVQKNTHPEPEAAAPVQPDTVTEPPLILPYSYRMIPREDGWQLLEHETAVGCLLPTDLDPASLYDGSAFQDNASSPLQVWLDRFVEPPLVKEYMVSSGTGEIALAVDLGCWNPQTGSGSWSHHYLFPREDICYDLILEDALVGPAALCDILWISGLDPDSHFIAADLSKLPQWPEIAEQPLDQLKILLARQAQRCDIEAYWGEPSSAAPDFSTMCYTAPSGTKITLTFTSDGVVRDVSKE